MSDIEEKIWQFLRGDLPIVEFEQWVYDTPELEELCGLDLYLELLSVDYRDKYAVDSIKKRLRFWLHERFPHSFPNINEDRKHGTLRINGQEIVGSVTRYMCEECNSFLVHHENYDSFFCPLCNIWTDYHPVCNDPGCHYCSLKRPQRPLRTSDDELERIR